MKEILIEIEVNDFWVRQQKEKGLQPFDALREMIREKFPQVGTTVDDNRLNVTGVPTEDSFRVRTAIKEFLQSRYQMSIVEGDYRLTAKTVYVGQTSQPRETAEQAPAEPARKTYAFPMPQVDQVLAELDITLKNAKKYDLQEIPWSVNFLLSVDSGFGVTTISQKIADVLQENGIPYTGIPENRVVELAVPRESQKAEQFWKRFREIQEKTAGSRSRRPLIYCLDISECLGIVGTREFRETLQMLSEYKKEIIYVFRIPYVEAIAFRKIRTVLEDIFLLRTIAVPPFSNEQMLRWLKEDLQQKGLRWTEEPDDLLERLLAEEKRDGSFRGIRTLNRLSSDILYHQLSRPGDCMTLTRSGLIRAYHLDGAREQSAREQLEHMCGMESVRRSVDAMVSQIQMYRSLKASGKKVSAPTMHMRFVGNPGTGKTSVARLVAEILKEKGILQKGCFYEIKGRSLCGRYVGETAPKTSGYCQDALGSVLFIDEAYSLYRGEGRTDFGQEAIDTLITEMENNRDNLVVIMAGYKKEMDHLLEANPGLESRMPYEILFRNYNREELVEIFYSMLGNNFAYTDEFDQTLRNFIRSIPQEILEQEDFSNARMIRNLYERIWSKAAYRGAAAHLEEITFEKCDAEQAIADGEFSGLLEKKKNKIGF